MDSKHRTQAPGYVELHCKTNFSFLKGASHPEEFVERASELGYRGLAITDETSLAGVVRAWGAAKEVGLPLIIGAEIHPVDSVPVVLWATDRSSYGRLCRLISDARLRCPKGESLVCFDDLVREHEGLLCGVIGGGAVDLPWPEDARPEDARPEVARPEGARPEGALRGDSQSRVEDELRRIRELFGDRAYLLAELTRGDDDRGLLAHYCEIGSRVELPIVASGGVHYHVRNRMVLHDCVTAIRLGTSIDQVRTHRFANAERHLRDRSELSRLYREYPEALERTLEVAGRCRFRLDELRYEYPEELAPEGKTPLEHLKRLVWEGAKARWPGGVPDKIIEGLRHELGLIAELRYEAYFLTVWDLVRFARERGILCQGRGSAANSMVCYCLGITSVDPGRMDLLFERFISRERDEAPDIDVDFEHQRREEVLQYIYSKYGRERAGMTAAVIKYRMRSAVRESGKAIGASLDAIDRLAKLADTYGTTDELAERMGTSGVEPESDLGKRWLYLIENLVGFPRHLSQHVGGMVMTRGPLCELAPIENAAMEGRTVIQWDKDDLEELGILKVDCLSLGMLSALRRCFEMVSVHYDRRWSLATLPPGDPETYDMICRADTVGVFQIESRAQMSMLPRLKPRCFYDLVIEVAIVRPGPIQGNMVHPFLKAREDPSKVVYPNNAIRSVLEKTLGVPIFQEQAMRLAVVAAGFTPGEADQLRRAMAAWRRPGVIDRFRMKLLDGMRERGLNDEFAEQVFQQIRGFGEYGFPESHAASFALLVYASCYLKCHYPAAFCAAILNSQPMGFYAPAQLVADARKHGVEVLGPDINASLWDCTLESPREANVRGSESKVSSGERDPALRLGLRMIRGLPESEAIRIVQERGRGGAYTSVLDLTRRARVGQGVLSILAESDALGGLSGDRRAALWETLGQERNKIAIPLFEATGADALEEDFGGLVPMTPMEEVHTDYETKGLSLRGHPVGFCRQQLESIRCVRASDLQNQRDGRYVVIAGIVLMRQRPSTAKGITFVTLEDETGSMNLVIHPGVWGRYLTIARTSNAWLVDGKIENRKGVIHVVVSQLRDLSGLLQGLENRSRDFR